MLCSTFTLAEDSVCYADMQQAPAFKTHKTWGQHGLSKQTQCGSPFGNSILGALPFFLVK